MILYASSPGRRLRQVLGDLGMVLWSIAWLVVGYAVHSLVASLAAPVRTLSGAGASYAGTMRDTAGKLTDLPLIGSRIADAFQAAATPGTDVQSSATQLADRIDQLGLLLGVIVAAAPILGLFIPWATRRWRFVTLATASARLIDSDADLDLFALRALATQPLPRLAAVADDPAGAWRARDPEVTRRLAALSLRDVGLRLPEGTGAGVRPRS